MRARSSAYDLDRALADGTAAPSAVAVLSALTQTRVRLEQQTALRPQFRDDLRRRLVAVAAVRPVDVPPAAPAPAPPGGAGRRRLALALAATGCAAAVGGLTLATERALPGEPLYAAKRATEDLRMRAPGDRVEKGMKHLRLADTRLEEVRQLALDTGDAVGLAGGSRWSASAAGSTAAGREAQIARTLEEMDEQTRLGSEDLRAAARESGETEVLLALWTWTQEQAVDLREVAVLLPTQVRERAETSLSVVAVVRRDAEAVLAEVCGAAATAAAECETPPEEAPAPLTSVAPGTSGTSDGPAGPPATTATPDPGTPGSTPSTSEPALPVPTTSEPTSPEPTSPEATSPTPVPTWPEPTSPTSPSPTPTSPTPTPSTPTPSATEGPYATDGPTGTPTPTGEDLPGTPAASATSPSPPSPSPPSPSPPSPSPSASPSPAPGDTR